MARSYVLDSSALLATLFYEPGANATDAAMVRSVLSAVNYAEVIGSQVRRGASIELATRIVDGLKLPIIPWDEELAREASDLCPLAWTHGLSLGDRACLATARHLRRTVLTAERKWKELPKLGIEIQIIR